jgi:nucleotide-binding universal stress UspA family protein
VPCILVGYDGSEPSKHALAFAAERARAAGRRLVLVTVVPASLRNAGFSEMLLPGLDLSSLVKEDKFTDVARKGLEEVAAGLRAQGLQVDVDVRHGDAADELLEAARQHDPEQVVLGFMSYEHKLPMGLGSVAEKVLRYADRTVTIVRPPRKKGPTSAR